jgi:hypothetical protein
MMVERASLVIASYVLPAATRALSVMSADSCSATSSVIAATMTASFASYGHVWERDVLVNAVEHHFHRAVFSGANRRRHHGKT